MYLERGSNAILARIIVAMVYRTERLTLWPLASWGGKPIYKLLSLRCPTVSSGITAEIVKSHPQLLRNLYRRATSKQLGLLFPYAKNSVSICCVERDNEMTIGYIFAISEFAAQQRSRRSGRCSSFHIRDCQSFTLSSCPDREVSAPGARARPRRGVVPH
jgi:hypothetical protein